MSPAKIPRIATKVLMPRFRKQESAALCLTEAVRRVLAHAARHPKHFAIFVLEGRLILSNVESSRFQQLENRWPASLIGTYGPKLKIVDLIDDLQGHFTDEVRA